MLFCALQRSPKAALCLGIKPTGGIVQVLGEAKASPWSRARALKWPMQAHTVRSLETSWDVKGKAERADKRN